ncbi:DMT family transporter [Dactylosporangium aurantiacum]|uniref:DMT family transporter n=1 Tax=Dactylosporangium aurantiacum TaxID=35754 RepID=A0A9Q9IM38_9ACTN|nr:DMT family transporter [Dactylosporangium aurantiacum]MDG6108970.1 DMT family transporter [Dactylosporangium aurantiacum]UWZ56525.1 DMT family transporter [Dactylosporangium aurantiacum]
MSRRGWILFIAMSVVWGVPYLLIKVAVRDIGPAELVFLRTAIGALLLLPIALYRKELRESFRPWLPLLAYTVIEIGVPWLLLSHAEQKVDSSLTGLVIAGVPLAAALIARERLSASRVAGLLTGLAGVGLLVGFHGGTGGAVPLLELLGVVVCYATGPLIIERWLADVPRYGVSTASLLLGALLFAPVAVPGLPSLARTVTPGPALAAVGLAVICTALAFVLFFALVAEVGGVRATVITFVNPAVAVVLGAAVLGEEITPLTVGAFALILAGSYLATRRRAAPAPAPDAEPAPVSS